MIKANPQTKMSFSPTDLLGMLIPTPDGRRGRSFSIALPDGACVLSSVTYINSQMCKIESWLVGGKESDYTTALWPRLDIIRTQIRRAYPPTRIGQQVSNVLRPVTKASGSSIIRW